ncbi:MAG: TorF family putative porin [Acidiferrobacterales bacterium]
MKKLTATLLAAGVIAGAGMIAPAMADGPKTNISFVSDYIFRGVSQTLNTAAVQGGLDWESGDVSYGIWGSAFAIGSEIDLYANYKLGPVSVGAIYYWYPLVDKLGLPISAAEINVGGDLGPVSLMASLGENSYYYAEAGYSMEVTKGMSLDLHVGVDNSSNSDYSVGIGTSAGGVDLGLTAANHSLTGSVFAVSIGKAM